MRKINSTHIVVGGRGVGVGASLPLVMKPQKFNRLPLTLDRSMPTKTQPNTMSALVDEPRKSGRKEQKLKPRGEEKMRSVHA